MLDWILAALDMVIPALHTLAVVLILLKMILVFQKKGFDMPALFLSFFRIYSKRDLYISDRNTRQRYMKVNNFINYYLYFWMLVTILILIVYQRPY